MANSLVKRDHYVVLGVSRDASAEEIKRTYRKQAKEMHPDALGPDVSAEDQAEALKVFQELSTAYEQLSHPELRKQLDEWLRVCGDFGFGFGDSNTYDRGSDKEYWDDFGEEFYGYKRSWRSRPEPEPIEIPEPHAFEVDGVWCWLTYELGHWSNYLRVTVRIPLDGLFHITGDYIKLPAKAYLEELIAVDAKGDVLGRGHSLPFLRTRVRQLQAEARRNVERRQWNTQLDGLEATRNRLLAERKPVGTLDRLLLKARSDVSFGSEGHWWRCKDRGVIVRSIREVEKEIDRVKALDATELLLDDLIEGRLPHRDLAYNERLLKKLTVYVVRSGGEYELPTPDQIRECYRDRIRGCKSHAEVLGRYLGLDDDEPTVLELAGEGLIELAPEEIEVKSNKGRVATCPVAYGRAKVDGEVVPVGIITISHAMYELNCATQHGRSSQLPKLPHDIQLLVRVRVTWKGKELLTDPRVDGKSLRDEIKRCEARLKNPRVVEDDFAMTLEAFLLL